MKIVVIQGPNLNRLGKRDPGRYGTRTLQDISAALATQAAELGVELDQTQSNHEGVLVDWLHERVDDIDAIIVNPASLTPYGRSLAQAIGDSGLPVAVVHISSVHKNARPGRIDLFAEIADIVITGCGRHGYRWALSRLSEMVGTPSTPSTPSTPPTPPKEACS